MHKVYDDYILWVNTFTWSYIISYGTILSMIGPGHSTASYLVHGLIALLPTGLMTGWYLSSKEQIDEGIMRSTIEQWMR